MCDRPQSLNEEDTNRALVGGGAAEATNAQQDEISSFKAYLQVWTYASFADAIARLVATIAALGAGVTYPMMAIIYGDLINDFNDWALGLLTPEKFLSAVGKNALYLVYLWIAKFGASYISALIYNITASRISRRLRIKYLSNVIHQPISFFDKHTAGTITTNLSTDVNAIEIGMGEKLAVFFQASAMITTAFIIGVVKNYKLTLASLTTVPWTLVVTGTIMTFDAKLELLMKGAYTEASTIVEEALSSATNIVALGAVDKIAKKYQVFVDRAVGKLAIRGAITALVYGNMFFACHACYALCLFYGVRLVSWGEIRDGGTVMTILLCVMLGSSSFGLIAPTIPEVIKAAASAKRVLSLIRKEDINIDGRGNESPLRRLEDDSFTGNLRLSNVSFSYPSRPNVSVLSDVTLEFPENEITAIVGPSGSGKSTIIGLLERWYDPDEGHVFLGDIDVLDHDRKSIRSHMGIVQQEPMLFNDTIFQNVLNGYHGGDVTGLSHSDQMRLVTKACIQADIHEFIMKLPNGYETNVGEKAAHLSGGQKQRIAIARAIISDPKILLLDEATSNLDPTSESLVRNALDSVAKGRTTIEVAHHLSTVRNAAKIVVMSGGKVEEQGTHESLLEKGGLYCRLLQGQGSDSDEEDKIERAKIAFQKEATALVTPEFAEDEEKALGETRLDSTTITRQHSLLWSLIKLPRVYPRMTPWLVMGLIAGLGISATFPITAYLFSKLITVFQLYGQPNFVERGNFWALMFFIVAISELVLYFIVWYFLGIATDIASRKFRVTYLRSMLWQDITFFQLEGHSAGALMSLLFSDPEQVELLVCSNLGLISVYVVDVIACCIYALCVYWRLALVAVFAGMPVIIGTGLLRTKMDMVAQDRCEQFFLEAARFSAEAVSSIRTVASLMLESNVIKKYEVILDESFAKASKSSLTYFILYALCDSLDLLVMALVFWYGGKLISEFKLDVDKYFIVYMCLMFGGQAAGFALGFAGNVSKSQAAANRMFFLQAKKPPINSTVGLDPRKGPQSDVAIEFQDVRFRYPSRPDVEVLRGFNLKISKGENICLVGASGCGKSTILSLVDRFFDVSSGEILIGGQTIRKLDIQGLRSIIAFVSQETTLYQGTIRENLLLGLPEEEVPDSRLEDVCRQSNIQEFIMSLPDGYNTDCGPRGLSLSGGQRQRMAIARSLLRNPDILLLDEATSALDPENEALVRAALEVASRERTTISSTHSVEIMKRADRVVVMDEGSVAEQGTFAELMEKKGTLWTLIRKTEFIK